MRSSDAAARGYGRRRLFRAVAIVTAIALAFAGLTAIPAHAAGPSLTITPTTWNIVGLDSNGATDPDGPNRFPVGVKVCNSGDAAATGVQTSFVWTTTNSYVNLVTPANTTRSLGTLEPGACAHATYDAVVSRVDAAFGTGRGYQITATAAGGLSASTPANRELYVEHLVSQARNAIFSIDSSACSGSSCTVYRGQTYQFTLTGKTATGGYEQLEKFINFPDSIFEIQDVDVAYSAPGGATNDTVYADACGWDPNVGSPTYLECVGPEQYAGGKAGGDPITTIYTVKVVGVGSGSLSALIYDFSGSSFHYNGDWGTGVNAIPFTAHEAADLSLSKSHTGPFVRGSTGTYTLTVSNAGPGPSGAITVTDTLPAGFTYRSFSGTGWSCSACSASSQTVTLTRSGLASGAVSSVDLTVDISTSAATSTTNEAVVTQAGSDTYDPAPNNSATNGVTLANAAPSADSQSVSMFEDTTRTFTLTGGDADGDALAYEITGLPDHGDLYEGTGTGGQHITSVPFELSGDDVTYEPDPDFNGADSFFFRTDDGAATSSPAQVSASVTAINDAPVAQDSTVTVGAGDDDAEVVLSSLVADKETSSQGLTYEIVTQPAHGTVQIDDDVVTYVNDGDRSGDQFTYRVTDRGDPDGCILVIPLSPDCDPAESDVATITVAFDNNPPNADSQTVTTAEDAEETVTLTGSDADDDDLTFVVTSLPAHGDLYAGGNANGAPITSTPFALSGALVTYDPDQDYNGPDSFGFKTSDGDADSVPATVSVDVTPINDRPASLDGTITVPHDQNSGNVDLADLVSDGETADDDLVYEIVSQGTRGTASLSGSTLTYTRTGSGHAPDQVTYKVTDRGDPDDCGAPAAGTCDGPLDSLVAQIDVDFQNSVPSADAQSVATDEDTTETVTLSGSDFHEDELSFVVTSLPVHGVLYEGSDATGPAITSTPFALSGTQVTYEPDAHYNGLDAFDFKASDGEVESSAARVSITVRPVNDAPGAADGTMTVPADDDTAQLDLADLANDRETSDGNLVYSIVDDPTDGTASVTGATVTYTRTTPGWDDDEFTFMVTDGGDPDDCGVPAPDTCAAPRDSNLATITVEFAYEPPTATDQQVSTPEDTAADVVLDGTSSGGRDLSFRVDSLPQHGALVDATTGTPLEAVPFDLSGDDVRYVPEDDYNGSDSFSFVTDDGVIESDAADVAITVTPVNDVPVAEDGDVTVSNDETVTLTLEGRDVDGDELTFEVVTPPATGTLGEIDDPVCNAGTCTTMVEYTPEPGHAGDVQLVYRVDDGTEESEPATITITVTDSGGGDGDGEENPPTPAPTTSESSGPTPGPGPTPTESPGPTPTPTSSESPAPSPTPTGTTAPGPGPSETPGPRPSETPGPGPTPSDPPLPTPPPPSPTPGHQCGDPIEVTALGDPIVGTPCSELIIVHAEVLATVEALGGDDTIQIDGSARVQVVAGRGNDEVDCTATPADVFGGAGDDVIRCGVSPDLIRGGRGDDVLNGGYGDDEIYGGKGSDRLEGSEGDDVMIASLGVDGLFGGPGADMLKGQAGDDELRGGGANDLLRGSGGNDVELGGSGDDVVRAGPGNDRLEGAVGNDRLVGNEGIDRVRGGQGDDVLRGQNGPDHLYGLKGNDVLKGAGGKNHLYGGWGDDTCVAPAQGNSWSSCERQLTHLA